MLRGSAERVHGLLSLDAVVTGAARSDARGRLFVDRQQFPAENDPVVAFRRYVEAGQSIVWNGARGVTEALDTLTVELARALRARVWPNVYATGAAAVPFGMHFDAHEVLAVQCEGCKEWTVSSVRVDRPLQEVPPGPALRAETERLRVLAPDQIATTFVAEPGDVLYLPRGQFHSARTPEQRSLHITFGIEPVSGHDLLQMLLSIALEEGLFRSYFPVPPADPDRRHAVEQVAALEARLVSIMQRGVFAATLDALQSKHDAPAGGARDASGNVVRSP